MSRRRLISDKYEIRMTNDEVRGVAVAVLNALSRRGFPLKTAHSTTSWSLDIRHSSFILAPCSTSVLFARNRISSTSVWEHAAEEKRLRSTLFCESTPTGARAR